MAYKNLNALNIVNVVNQQVNKIYSTSLPAVDKNNFSNMADQLRRAPDVVQNKWIDTLINVVGMQLVANKRSYESYFRKLHLGETTTEDIQMIMTDLIKSKAYSPHSDMDRFFEDDVPEVGAQYITSTIKKFFPVSINEETLYAAFLNQDRFMEFVYNTVDNVLYSSLNYEDVLQVKDLVSKNIEQGNIFLIPLAKVTDQATALAFTAKVKAVTSDMEVEPTRKYNLSGFATYTSKDEGVIISDTETKAITETYSLAWAFNKDYLALEQGGQAITMATDSFANGSVFALYADRYVFQIRDKVGFPRVATQYFGDSLTLKRWLHYQGVWAVSYFHNVAGFADINKIAEANDIQTLALASRSGSLAINKGAKDQIYVSSFALKSTAIAADKVFDKFGSYEISGNNSADTVIDTFSGKIYIGKDETAASITVTFTSHLDENVTATATVTVNGNS